MEVIVKILYALVIVVALLLTILILIQPSKSGGMGAAFGGVGESVFGGKAGSHLTKTTVIMTAIFFSIALVLAAVIGLRRADSGVRKELEKVSAAQTAAPVEKTAPAGK